MHRWRLHGFPCTHCRSCWESLNGHACPSTAAKVLHAAESTYEERLIAYTTLADLGYLAPLVANNPQLQQQQIQAQLMARQRQIVMMQQQQQQQAQQQNGGVPMNLPNGGNPPMSAAQFAAMQQGNNVRGVNLPPHIQQQMVQAQAAATHHQQQQQQQAQQQQHQQHQQQQQQQQQHQQQQQQQQHAMQQLAMQQAVSQPGGQGQAVQQPQMRAQSQQIQGMHEAQAAAAAQQQQQQQQQHQAQQQVQQQQQAQAAQEQHQAQQQQHQAQQQAAAAAAMMQPRVTNPLRGASVLKLLQFGDHLSQFSVSPRLQQYGPPDGTHASQPQARKQSNDLNYWQNFVDRFFSPSGVLRQQVWNSDTASTKQFEISTPALPRYYWTHFTSGVQNMQMTLENAREKDLPNGGHFVESAKSCFIYWFVNGCQVSNDLPCYPCIAEL